MIEWKNYKDKKDERYGKSVEGSLSDSFKTDSSYEDFDSIVDHKVGAINMDLDKNKVVPK